MSRSPLVATLAALLALPGAARADSLDALLADARAHSLALREERALVGEAVAEARLERAALWPSLTITGAYRRNQHEVELTIPAGAGGAAIDATLVPLNQLDAQVTLAVPVVDVVAWRRIDAAEAVVDARRAAAEAAAVDVDRAVVIAWYRWVAGTALVDAAEVSAATAADTLAVVEGRAAAGFASQLDVARARADLARTAQDLAEAELIVASAVRELRTLTGRAPEGAAPPLPDDLSEEAPLDTWTGEVDALPDVRAARASLRAGEVARSAAAAGWLPTVSVFAAERLTNAEGFGEPATFSAGVTATWRLDAASVRAVGVAEARVATGAVRAARVAEAARDRIVGAYDAVVARRAAAEAAAAQLAAAREGLDVARTRIASGLATPLDLSTAQRDLFGAEVAVVQARADLAAARALLRLAAGREVE